MRKVFHLRQEYSSNTKCVSFLCSNNQIKWKRKCQPIAGLKFKVSVKQKEQNKEWKIPKEEKRVAESRNKSHSRVLIQKPINTRPNNDKPISKQVQVERLSSVQKESSDKKQLIESLKSSIQYLTFKIGQLNRKVLGLKRSNQYSKGREIEVEKLALEEYLYSKRVEFKEVELEIRRVNEQRLMEKKEREKEGVLEEMQRQRMSQQERMADERLLAVSQGIQQQRKLLEKTSRKNEKMQKKLQQLLELKAREQQDQKNSYLQLMKYKQDSNLIINMLENGNSKFENKNENENGEEERYLNMEENQHYFQEEEVLQEKSANIQSYLNDESQMKSNKILTPFYESSQIQYADKDEQKQEQQSVSQKSFVMFVPFQDFVFQSEMAKLYIKSLNTNVVQLLCIQMPQESVVEFKMFEIKNDLQQHQPYQQSKIELQKQISFKSNNYSHEYQKEFDQQEQPQCQQQEQQRQQQQQLEKLIKQQRFQQYQRQEQLSSNFDLSESDKNISEESSFFFEALIQNSAIFYLNTNYKVCSKIVVEQEQSHTEITNTDDVQTNNEDPKQKQQELKTFRFDQSLSHLNLQSNVFHNIQSKTKTSYYKNSENFQGDLNLDSVCQKNQNLQFQKQENISYEEEQVTKFLQRIYASCLKEFKSESNVIKKQPKHLLILLK